MCKGDNLHMDLITKNFLKIKKEIQICERKYNRTPNSVKLLAVSKGQSINKLESLIQSGQIFFGESYLQEALPKIEKFKNVEWHFIGTIQRNKTKKIGELFSWVQSVTTKVIAKRLNDQRPSHLPPLNICLEVNVSEEKSKSGILFDEIIDLADYCISLPHLKLRGLMAIPKQQKDFTKQRQEFNKIKIMYENLLAKGYPLDTLSIGMSDDWEAAIAEGATMIRIGTALFGPRN